MLADLNKPLLQQDPSSLPLNWACTLHLGSESKVTQSLDPDLFLCDSEVLIKSKSNRKWLPTGTLSSRKEKQLLASRSWTDIHGRALPFSQRTEMTSQNISCEQSHSGIMMGQDRHRTTSSPWLNVNTTRKNTVQPTVHRASSFGIVVTVLSLYRF